MKQIQYNKTSSEHIHRNIKLFEELGYQCVQFSFAMTKLFPKPFVVYLNWFENLYMKNDIIMYLILSLQLFTLYVCKLFNIKIVASFHNKEPHTNKHNKLSNYMFRLVFKSASRIVIFNEGGRNDLKRYLNDEEIQKKTVCIPPINYIGVYPYVRHDWITNIENRKGMKVLFAGSMVQSYKNAEMIMDIAHSLKNEDIYFIFAGKVKDENQKQLFIKKTKGLEHVCTMFRFVKDDEMAQLLEMCDVLVIPYDIESINNSGTARMAFSYGRTVICPKIPSMESVPEDLAYLYTYNNRDDHRLVVEKIILSAYSEWIVDGESLHIKGEKLKEQMETFNSPQVVRENYRKLFESFNK